MRVANLTGNEICGCCEMAGWKRDVQSGLAVAGYRMDGNASVPLYGPCPYCERGYRKEFPSSRDSTIWWNGYWQGREPEVEPLRPGEFELSRIENGMRLVLLERRRKGEDVDPAVGLEPLLPERERLAILDKLIRRA